MSQLFAQSLTIDVLIQKNGEELRGHFIRFEEEQVIFITLKGDSLHVPFQGVLKIVKTPQSENFERSPNDSPRGHLRAKFENSISLNILTSIPPSSDPFGGAFNEAGTSLMLGMGYRINPHIYFGLQTLFELMTIQALPILGEVKLNLKKKRFSPFAVLGAGYYQEIGNISSLFAFGLSPFGFKGFTSRNGIGMDVLLNSSTTLSFSLAHRYYDLESNFDTWNNKVVTKAQLNRLAFGIGLQF